MDRTSKNRVNQSAFELGLALGVREEVENLAEDVPVEMLALLYAKLFFTEILSGNAEYSL